MVCGVRNELSNWRFLYRLHSPRGYLFHLLSLRGRNYNGLEEAMKQKTMQRATALLADILGQGWEDTDGPHVTSTREMVLLRNRIAAELEKPR